MRRRRTRAIIAIAALLAIMPLVAWGYRESTNAVGIDLNCRPIIPDELPEDPVTPSREWPANEIPRYLYWFRAGFEEELRDKVAYRPYPIRNELWSIDSYAMEAVRDGRKACLEQLDELSREYGEDRVLRPSAGSTRPGVTTSRCIQTRCD